MRKTRAVASPLPDVPLTALLPGRVGPELLPLERLWSLDADGCNRGIRYNLKRQCETWGLPWAARLVPKEACTPEMLHVARNLSGSTFSQTLPHGFSPAAMRLWARLVTGAGSRNAAWMAHNALRLVQLSDSVTAMRVADYANHSPAFATSKNPAVVLQESAAWHEEQREWRAERAAELRDRVATREDGLVNPTSRIRYAWAKAPIRHEDYELRLLTSRIEVDDEAYAMRHCVWRYWPMVQAGESIIGSIRHRGLRKATTEFDDVGVLVQVLGPANRKASRRRRGTGEGRSGVPRRCGWSSGQGRGEGGRGRHR